MTKTDAIRDLLVAGFDPERAVVIVYGIAKESGYDKVIDAERNYIEFDRAAELFAFAVASVIGHGATTLDAKIQIERAMQQARLVQDFIDKRTPIATSPKGPLGKSRDVIGKLGKRGPATRPRPKK